LIDLAREIELRIHDFALNAVGSHRLEARIGVEIAGVARGFEVKKVLAFKEKERIQHAFE